MTYLEATPAYGRDYTSQAAVLKDWHANKDFIVHAHGLMTYINKRDKPANLALTVRYANLRKVMVIK